VEKTSGNFGHFLPETAIDPLKGLFQLKNPDIFNTNDMRVFRNPAGFGETQIALRRPE
jgi:hypothetical protein